MIACNRIPVRLKFRDAEPAWPNTARILLADWLQDRTALQKESDASIAANVEFDKLELELVEFHIADTFTDNVS